MSSATLRALLAELIDYAGLFPPAALPMADIVANYGSYRASSDSCALGRLVVPASRLGEFSGAIAPLDAGAGVWRVSALIGDDAAADARIIAEASACDAGHITVDTVEVKAATTSAIAAAVKVLGESRTIYIEIPLVDDPQSLVEQIRHSGARAKVRTGGVTKDVFPTAAQLARFISVCAARDVPFKATAGLHHPLRGEYPLTYAADAARGTMFGFLNVFLAAAFARAGMPEDTLARLLDERDAAAIRVTDTSVTWCGAVLSTDEITAARRALAIAFGSCSFREPIDDLHRLGLL